MKIRMLLLTAVLCFIHSAAYATDLVEAYQDALLSDPVFQQAIAQRFATKEGVPISIAAVLPNIYGKITPLLTRTGFAGTNLQPVVTNSGVTIYPRNTTTRNYVMSLNIRQTIFDFAKFSQIANAVAMSKYADATLNAALQNLMKRVANAYFAVLNDEDNVSYSRASQQAYQEQLSQINEQYRVGLKTLTDVYTAQASYDLSVATVIAAETKLTNDRENLRVITGKYYPHLLTLSDRFPLLTPKPSAIDAWVDIAQQQNWTIRAAQYNVDAALQTVRQQFAGHLPTIALTASMDRLYTDNINRYVTFSSRNGPGIQTDRTVGLSVDIPIFSGGGVVAQTNQATYNYQIAQQQLEKTVRDTLNNTRQSYLGILSGISQVNADRQAIKSNISSLDGMQASYQAGTETLFDVLNQRQKVFQAQTQYASDRYAFINNIILLKQSAGTLSFDDIVGLNGWLVEPSETSISQLPAPQKKVVNKKKKRKKITVTNG